MRVLLSALFSLMALLACNGDYSIGGCPSDGSLLITKYLPKTDLKLNDSIVVNMSNHWKGSFECSGGSYNPEIYLISTDPTHLEARSVGPYLILKAISSGSAKVKVYGRSEVNAERCYMYQLSQPVSFVVYITDHNNPTYPDALQPEHPLWISNVTVTPESFQKGDTLTLHCNFSDPLSKGSDSQSLYTFSWFSGNSTLITDWDSDNDCYAAVRNSSASIKTVAMNSDHVSGYVLIDRPETRWADDAGFQFDISSDTSNN